MSGKAVYNMRCLNIYLTRESFQALIDEAGIVVPLHLGPEPQEDALVLVALDDRAWEIVRAQAERERAAIEGMRAQAPRRERLHPRKRRKTRSEHGEAAG